MAKEDTKVGKTGTAKEGTGKAGKVINEKAGMVGTVVSKKVGIIGTFVNETVGKVGTIIEGYVLSSHAR